jgi:transmembrane sensor
MKKDLLIKYILEEVNPEEKIQIQNWIDSHPMNKKEYIALKKTWEMSKGINQNLPEVDVDLAWEKFLENKASIEEKNPPIKNLDWKKTLMIAASTTVLVLIGLSWYLYSSNSSYVEVVSGKEYIKSILPDGSTVNLNRNANLTFDKQWLVNNRNVFLKQGEVFFDVKRDEKSPFIITSGKSKITVLGTSFHVSREKNITNVIVASGSVKVNFENQEVILSPKETVTISDNDIHTLRVDTIKDELYKYYIAQEFIFENTPLKRVFAVLAKAYDKQIILEDPKKAKLLYTATFKQQNLNEMMNVIVQTFELKIEKRNNSYYVK